MTGFNSKRQASKALLQQVLDALELDALEHPGTINNQIGWADKARELCDALSAALFDRGAAVAESLTDGELRECFTSTNTSEPLSEGWPGLERFARAVEQAHGIKGSAA